MTKRKKSTLSKGHRPARAAARRPAPKPGKAKPDALPSVPEFIFAADCLVNEAADLKGRLARLLSEPRPVTVDIGALQRIDTAGLQVLAAFVRERGTRSLQTQWRGAAPCLTSAAQLLGLTSLLGLVGEDAA